MKRYTALSAYLFTIQSAWGVILDDLNYSSHSESKLISCANLLLEFSNKNPIKTLVSMPQEKFIIRGQEFSFKGESIPSLVDGKNIDALQIRDIKWKSATISDSENVKCTWNVNYKNQEKDFIFEFSLEAPKTSYQEVYKNIESFIDPR